ncbi:MAG: S8 family serine peptidase [Sulfuricella sp.]|nr:S8 family serine peptidase [Sulfuricella sp.]
MKRLFCCTLVPWLLLCSPAGAQTDLAPTEILVKYRHDAAAPAGRAIGHNVVAVPLADTPASRENRLRRHLAHLRADPAVIYAEPNYHGHFEDLPPTLAVPNDPGYASQGWLDSLGARQAWAVATGKGVTVAVVDSGVDLAHPDLMNNLRSDGYNFGDGNAVPQDVLGHGTFVAGILAAQCGNATAGCGLAPETRILPIKINIGSTNDFDSAALAQSVDYAVAHGAAVINLSVSVSESTQTVGEAIQRALDAGVVVVVAAGNGGGAVKFPGTYPGVITVAGTNLDGTLWSGSCLGSEVTLGAPATGVTSTVLGGGFGIRSQGTSYATPMVAASVAGILQLDRRFDHARIAALLRANALPLAPGGYDFGILAAGQTLLALLPDLIPEKRDYANGDMVRLDYRLPPTGGPVDIYVAVTLPSEEVSLKPDGTWQRAAVAGYAVTGSAYGGAAASSGTLFGSPGIFPPIRLEGFPAGRYVWRSVLINRQSLSAVGPIIESPLTIK